MKSRSPSTWVPAGLLGLGCALNLSISAQRTMTLTAPLSTVPTEMLGFKSTDLELDQEQVRVAGTSSLLFRRYEQTGMPAFSLYVGYYAQQRQGKTIHSPKNCLPGAGWEPLESRPLLIPGEGGTSIRVNRFVVANKDQRALVYYWYQGRGRTESNEYRVKLDLILDSALRHRTEEALVRIVVPLSPERSEADTDAMASRIVRAVNAKLVTVLPA
jgi:EpsI family protein